MSVRAPVGDINIAYEKCCIGRGLCAIRSKNNFKSYLYYLMLDLKKKLDVYNNEGTVFGAITKEALNSILIIKSDIKVVYMFENLVSKLDEHFYSNVKQIRNLQKLRDTLLPKLMSGEIRVDLNNGQITMKNNRD